MAFSPKRLLRLISGLFLLLASAHLAAQTERHTIIVLDLGLPADDLARASELSRALAEQIPSDHRLALVGADEIVHHFIEPVSGPSFAVEFDAIAGELTTSEFSSYSSGLERAVELARETGAPSTLLLFTNGVINASDPTRKDRYQQWAQSILIPDAASADMRLLFASATALPDSLIAAMQQASERNAQIDFTTTSAEQIAQMLRAPDAAATAATTLAVNSAATEQQAAEEKAQAEQLAAEQQAAEEKARAEQLAAEQQAAEEKARAEQLAAEQQQAAEETARAEQLAAEEKPRAEELVAQQNAATDNPDTMTNTDLATSSTAPAISITAVPAEGDSGNSLWIAAGAGILAVLLGVAGWLFARRRGGAASAAPARSTAERQAAYSDIRKSGETTQVKRPAAAASPHPEAQSAAATVTTHDAATMINPETAASALAMDDDEATRVNTDSHAFADSPPAAADDTATAMNAAPLAAVDADDTATAMNAAPLAAVDADEPTVATGKPPVATSLADKPLHNPADEFDVFEKSISAKRATGKESAEQRKSASMAALTRDRTFDPALDTDASDK